jgi:hypothetical protein
MEDIIVSGDADLVEEWMQRDSFIGLNCSMELRKNNNVNSRILPEKRRGWRGKALLVSNIRRRTNLWKTKEQNAKDNDSKNRNNHLTSERQKSDE